MRKRSENTVISPKGGSVWILRLQTEVSIPTWLNSQSLPKPRKWIHDVFWFFNQELPLKRQFQKCARLLRIFFYLLRY